jgi:hypothetical protein
MDWLKHWSSRVAMMVIVILLLAGLATSFPADIGFLMAIDLGTWIEAAIAVYVVAQVTKIRPLVSFLRVRLFNQRRSKRQIRTRVPRRQKSISDDDPAPKWALAA